ncbi:MAG TPA: NB-ARC domain-containing protein [Ktedonobacteraceae bacterium]|nr:NB-ARC domain-containing protein [Ktedonobacteraceae bacterium]
MQTHPLAAARIAHGWSQAQLAEQIGVSGKTVARWELGHNLPYRIHRERLCHLFGLDSYALGLLPMPTATALRDPFIPEELGKTERLLGRDDLLSLIKRQLLGKKRHTSIALQGLPGVGKTALAAAIASDAQVQAHFPDGILWARSGPQADVLASLVHWGSLLGLKEANLDGSSSYADLERALRLGIGRRRMLVIIDDAWTAEAALALQVGGSQCTYLLTTRLPHVASTFAQGSTILVPELAETDGLALLTGPVPQLVDQHKETAQRIVHMVGGLPVALNLLGRYLATLAPTGQPRRMLTTLARLAERSYRLHVGVPMPLIERPLGLASQPTLSLYATIHLSVKRLNREEQAMLAALALFPTKPHSFSEATALAVSGGSVEQLDALWDAGLLESCGLGKYTLHPAIADYARELNTGHALATPARSEDRIDQKVKIG